MIELMGAVEMDVDQGYDGQWYVAGYAPVKPQELIEAEALAEAKAERAAAVAAITVTVDGMTFDGDEIIPVTEEQAYDAGRRLVEICTLERITALDTKSTASS